MQEMIASGSRTFGKGGLRSESREAHVFHFKLITNMRATQAANYQPYPIQ
jgi:hypothetical protein